MLWLHRFLLWLLGFPIALFLALLPGDNTRTAMFAYLGDWWRRLTVPQVILLAALMAFYAFLIVWTGRDRARVRRERYKTKLQEIFHDLDLQFMSLASAKDEDELAASIARLEEENLDWSDWFLNNMGEPALRKFTTRIGPSLEYNWNVEASQEAKNQRSNVMDALRKRAANVEDMLQSDVFDPVRPPKRRTWYGRKIDRTLRRDPSRNGEG